MARFVVGSQGRAVSPMVVSVHNKPLVGERIGNVIVSADVLTHAMYQQDDARGRLVVLRVPAIAGELPAVGRTAAERMGSHHRIPFERLRRGAGEGEASITAKTLKWSDRNSQVSTLATQGLVITPAQPDL